MSRAITNVEMLNAEATGDVLLAFALIEHPQLLEPLRVVSDVLPYSWGGHEWVAVPFGFRVLSDTDTAAETRVVIPNVNRRIGNALLAMSGRAQISVWVLSSDDFDLSVEPREPVGTPTPLYSFTRYDLVDITGDAVQISGRVILRDYSQEPWPGTLATESRCPGLFV